MAFEIERSRQLDPVSSWIQKFLLITLILAGMLYISSLHFILRVAVYPQQYAALFLALSMSATFLTVPMHSKAKRLPWYDIIFALLSFALGIYVVLQIPAWTAKSGFVEPARWIPAWIAIPLIIEATRRVVGPTVAILVLVLIAYAKFGFIIPGILGSRDMGWPLLGQYLFIDPAATFGIPIKIISTIVLGFIIFGSLLIATGSGRVLTDFALSTFGGFSGGPAKVATISSSLFGTLSGSVSANIVLTGSMTIPMMKSIGYKPHIAAAIEGAASTGGQIMPPVMGAAAFLMATFLGLPYYQVAIAALFPAVLFYLAVFLQVHFEAKKEGLLGLPREQLPRFISAIRATWILVIPLGLLIYLLFFLAYNPAKSALIATAVSFIIAFSRKGSRLDLSGIAKMLANAGRLMADIGVMAAAAGIIVGVVQVTGAAFAMTLIFGEAGESMVPLLLLLAAVVSMLLGMGMTSTAVYILMAVLVAPAVIALGINPLAAHLFVFYFAVMSYLTPPVAPAAWVAAPIAGAPMMKTGWACARMGIVGYIVPFIFVFSPALLLQGHFSLLLPTVITALTGLTFLAIGVAGYLFSPLGRVKRTLFILAGLGLFMPIEFGLVGIAPNIFGGIVGIIMTIFEWQNKQKQTP